MKTMKNDKEEVMYSRWDPTYPLDMRGLARPILVWRYCDAPEEIKELANHGGDEDWVALVPLEVVAKNIHWMDEGTTFGCCSVKYIVLRDATLVVGTHV
jgi:hypothetical protein